MLWKALLVLLLVAVNGFFVAAEFALVKARLSEIRLLARAGSRTARLVERILGRLDAYLSACQLGITVASLVLGWVGEPCHLYCTSWNARRTTGSGPSAQ